MTGPPFAAEQLDSLYAAAYEELRRLASAVRRSDPGTSLSPTTLVNEAWMKLAASPPRIAASRLHFKRIAARAMRQVLVEAARRRTAGKRGGGAVAMVTFEDGLDVACTQADEVIALHDALDVLAAQQPRLAEMVECRFFGGLTASETAEVIGVSEATVLRDWRAARAWLAREIRRG